MKIQINSFCRPWASTFARPPARCLEIEMAGERSWRGKCPFELQITQREQARIEDAGIDHAKIIQRGKLEFKL
jgi:hypothetical protein